MRTRKNLHINNSPLVNASPLDLYFGLKAETDCVLILDHLEAAATADHPLPNFANSAFLSNHSAYKQHV